MSAAYPREPNDWLGWTTRDTRAGAAGPATVKGTPVLTVTMFGGIWTLCGPC
jgi:hypothetical protein